jgi:hypothetical protein
MYLICGQEKSIKEIEVSKSFWLELSDQKILNTKGK